MYECILVLWFLALFLGMCMCVLYTAGAARDSLWKRVLYLTVLAIIGSVVWIIGTVFVSLMCEIGCLSPIGMYNTLCTVYVCTIVYVCLFE